MKLGLLLPQSKVYPTSGNDFANGLMLCLEQVYQQDVRLCMESIGVGGYAEDIIGKAQRLIVQERVDLFTGIVAPLLLEKIHPFFHANKRLFVMNHLGGHVFTQTEDSPNLFYNSLALWESSMVLGKYAAEHIGKRTALFTSFYNSGYGFSHAFDLGIKAKGGELGQTFVAKEIPTLADVEFVKDAIGKEETHALLGIFHKEESPKFVKATKEKGVQDKYSLLLSPMAVEDSILSDFQGGAGAISCVPWFIGMENEANRRFVDLYEEEYEELPNVFALLGYETGILIGEAMKHSDKKRIKADDILAIPSLEGPRASWQLNAKRHATCSKHHIVQLEATEGKAHKLNVLQSHIISDEEHLQVEQSQPEIVSGWVQPYTFV